MLFRSGSKAASALAAIKALPEKATAPDGRYGTYVPRLIADLTGDLEGGAKPAPAKKGKKKAQ